MKKLLYIFIFLISYCLSVESQAYITEIINNTDKYLDINTICNAKTKPYVIKVISLSTGQEIIHLIDVPSTYLSLKPRTKNLIVNLGIPIIPTIPDGQLYINDITVNFSFPMSQETHPKPFLVIRQLGDLLRIYESRGVIYSKEKRRKIIIHENFRFEKIEKDSNYTIIINQKSGIYSYNGLSHSPELWEKDTFDVIIQKNNIKSDDLISAVKAIRPYAYIKKFEINGLFVKAEIGFEGIRKKKELDIFYDFIQKEPFFKSMSQIMVKDNYLIVTFFSNITEKELQLLIDKVNKTKLIFN